MAWSKHSAEVHPELILGDRGSLSLIARVSLEYHPAEKATYWEPGGDATVTGAEVTALWIDRGDGKRDPIALESAIADWIAETLDTDDLVSAAEDSLACERDAAADAKLQEWEDERRERGA